jgi:hypothetical protein
MRACPGLVLVLWLAVDGSAVAADQCTAVQFARGTSSAEITGLAPAEDTICYSLETGADQNARIEVLEGSNVMFSIEGLIDAQDDYSFRTERRTYRVLVGQLMRAAEPMPFRIRMTVTGKPGR